MADGRIVISTKLDTKPFEKEAAKLSNKLNRLKDSIKKLAAATGLGSVAQDMSAIGGAAEGADKKTSKAVINVKAKIAELEAALLQYDLQRDEIANRKMQELGGLPYSKEQLYAAVEAALLADKEYLKLGTSAEQTELKLAGLIEKLRLLNVEQSKTPPQTQKTKKSFSEMAKAAVPLSKRLLTLGKMFQFMLMRMVIRGVINAVKKGFQDLAQSSSNANKYLSSIQSSVLNARNALTAAFAPAIQAIAPWLERLADGFLKVANAVAAFTARIYNGASTYLKAKKVQTDYAASLNKTGKEAKKASKSLAGFDDLNVLTAPDAGAGASGTPGMPTPAEMFEEVSIPDNVMSFADRLNVGLQFVKNNLDTILAVAGMIGGAILGWKIASAFTTSLGKLAGVALIVAGTIGFLYSVFDMLKNGVDWDNLIVMLVSVAAVVAGLGLLFGSTAAMVGLLIAGIVMLGIGIYDWIKKGELTTQTFWLLVAAIAAVGIALAVLLGWPALLVAAILIAALAIYKYWEDIKEFFIKVKDWFVNTFKDIWEDFKIAVKALGDLFSQLWTDIKNAFQGAKEWFSNLFKGVWEGIKGAFGDIAEWFREKFAAAWEAVKNVFSKGGQIFSGIKDGILNGLKTVINGLIDGINRVIKIPFDGLNTALRNIKKISIMGFEPFSFLGTLTVPQIPKLATGAVIPPRSEFLAILGDQRQGRNIETPESLLRQIFREELGRELGQSLYFGFKRALAEAGGVGSPEVNVFIGNDQIDALVERANRRNLIRNNGR
jgi:hypothetical protein